MAAEERTVYFPGPCPTHPQTHPDSEKLFLLSVILVVVLLFWVCFEEFRNYFLTCSLTQREINNLVSQEPPVLTEDNQTLFLEKILPIACIQNIQLLSSFFLLETIRMLEPIHQVII